MQNLMSFKEKSGNVDGNFQEEESKISEVKITSSHFDSNDVNLSALVLLKGNSLLVRLLLL